MHEVPSAQTADEAGRDAVKELSANAVVMRKTRRRIQHLQYLIGQNMDQCFGSTSQDLNHVCRLTSECDVLRWIAT